MREIKYRQKLKPAYAKFCGEFHYWGFIDGAFHGPTGKNEACGESEQYTGLKDKNGVEIYEGDVSRKLHYVDDDGNAHYLHHLIEWSDKFNGFFARNLNAKDDWDGNLLLWVYAKEDFEIIGSIHENQELLEKNND